MERIVTSAAPYLYALLRIIGALLYACHGAQKLLGLFGGVREGTVPISAYLPLFPRASGLLHAAFGRPSGRV